MKDFVKKIAPNAKNVVTDGFFYKYCLYAKGTLLWIIPPKIFTQVKKI